MNKETTNPLNSATAANRLQIGILGCVNSGKSTVINGLTQQQVSIVSQIKGTTTDPVKKAMELLPAGPVTFIDTAGLDDNTPLGISRMEATYKEITNMDLAIVVCDVGDNDKIPTISKLLARLHHDKTPFILVLNKCDLVQNSQKSIYVELLKDNLTEKAPSSSGDAASKDSIDLEHALFISAKHKDDIDKLRHALTLKAIELSAEKNKTTLLSGLARKNQVIILVTPIDSSAPKGRLILPQVQAIRDALDHHAIVLVVQTHELSSALAALSAPPALVITDSQDFHAVAKILDESIPLTSFSILFARLKADIKAMVQGAHILDTLNDGANILISEGCTHHRQCDDIGTVKLPSWIQKHCAKTFNFHFTQGKAFPDNLSPYDLVIHCGGCMLVDKQVQHRQHQSVVKQVPFTNYGIVIAYLNGILERAIKPILDNNDHNENDDL